tara:strand:+ start:468 stop:728 length:261 start_codon:yes stop_codon:yes gene_type:complete
MEIENQVTVHQQQEAISVRSCTSDKVAHENLHIQECEDEGEYYVGLATKWCGIQIKIEDVPVLMNTLRQAYEKQVVNEHLYKWGNR